MMKSLVSAATVAMLAGMASAQPTITSLGSGNPLNVTNGSAFIGGTARWTNTAGVFSMTPIGGGSANYMSDDGLFHAGMILNNPAISGVTATGINPPFSIPSTFTPFPLPTTANIAARWNSSSSIWTSTGGLLNDAFSQAYRCFGSGSSTDISSSRDISADGRFIAGQTYISTFNTAGTAIAANNTFRFRGFVWDAAANAGAGGAYLLPTPMNVAGTRRRDGRAIAINADGSVVVGAQDPSSSGSADVPDPDGSRPIVYRWNSATNQYDLWSYLPDGVQASGNPIGGYGDGFFINAAGTIICGMSRQDVTGTGFLTKWAWNAGTSTWDRTMLGSALETNPAWLPPSVTGCGIPPSFTPTGMSEDGNTIVGFTTWSTCGSFLRGGFIWTAASGQMQDWYEYCVQAGIPGIEANYSPIDINNQPVAVGIPRLGNPLAISPDGSSIAGAQGGNQIVVGAVPWVLQMTGGPTCVAPFVTTNPSDTLYTRCSTFGIILNARAGGTLPITYQWYRNGQPLSNGPTGNGNATVTGATDSQMRITGATSADAGSFYCVATGCNGQSVTTTTATAAIDTSIPAPANDICSTATDVAEGSFPFNICNAWNDEGTSQCLITGADNGDVWYRYTPTFTGEARFQTCGSSFNSTLMLLDACGPSGNLLACNDDVGTRGLVGTSCSSSRSLISRFAVTQGVPVLVRVGAVGTPNGTGSLVIGVAPPLPVNDDCATAIDVGIGATAFNLAEATDDGFNFGCTTPSGNATSNRDLWYRLVSECGGTYTIGTCGSTISNPMLHVFDSCGNLTQLACNDNVGSGVTGCTSNQARVLDLAIGESVLIRVSASGNNPPSSGAGTLTISGTPQTQCCDPDVNCDFALNGGDVEVQELAVGGNMDDYCQADPDYNGDFALNGLDVEAVEVGVGGGGCP